VELPLDRIRSLYDAFREADPWPDWRASYLAELTRLQSLTDDQIRQPDSQRALWSAKALGGLGSGEHVKIGGALEDEEIVGRLIRLRGRQSDDPGRRAKDIQRAYDVILVMVRERHSQQRPQARLARLFAVLLPADVHACYTRATALNVWRLLLKPRKCRVMESRVLARARLRQALGEEEDLEEHVRRSIFCWWLSENVATIEAGDTPASQEQSTGPEPEPLPTLVFQTFANQAKGIPAIGGYVDTYRAVVIAAEGGATPEDIVETMRSDLGLDNLTTKSCRRLFNRVRRLGFLTHREGLWYPSPDGQTFIDEDPPDILVERLLTRQFGLAWLLRLMNTDEPKRRLTLCAEMKEIYPNWTSNFMPSAIMGWAHSLGLWESLPDNRRRLTPYGLMWTRRLPADLPSPPPIEVSLEEHPDIGATGEPSSPAPTLEQLLDAFRDDPDLRGFVFDPDQLRALHTAWHCNPKKRFVILSGLSGTGKTAVLLHYARLYCAHMGLDVEKHRAIVPVAPDWRDPSGLLGYFNALHADPTFQAEPALALVLAAAKDPQRPYFLILDEMNLARVERYFAPFLSAMETGERLHLHAHEDSVNDVPPSVPWPRNLFIGGTVNMDETTHPFSDKVLDRAFTLEFWKVELNIFFDRRAADRDTPRRAKLETLLIEINALLFGIRRHFGYRSAGEILDFVDAALGDRPFDPAADWTLADHAVFSKVLPRLRGAESPALVKALADLEAKAKETGLTRCEAKLQLMRERLKATGVTRFWS